MDLGSKIKNIRYNHNISQEELARMLEAQGANVYMTRVGDVDVALNDRVKLAKAYDADMFVSIHLNSANFQNNLTSLYE